MTLPYLRGWWDEIKEPVESLSKSLPRIINPDIDTLQAIKAQGLNDPTYFTKIANMSDSERDSFFSSLQLRKPQSRTAVMQMVGMEPGLERKKGERTERFAAEEEKLFKQHIATPEGAEEAAAAITRGKTSAERAKDRAALDFTRAQTGNIEVDKKLNEARLADVERTEALINRSFAAYPDLKGVNVSGVVDDIFANKQVDPNLMNRLVYDPGAKTQLAELFKIGFVKREEAFRKSLEQAKESENPLLNLNVANQLVSQMSSVLKTNQQDLEDWLKSPAGMIAAGMLASSGKKPSAKEQVAAKASLSEYETRQNEIAFQKEALKNAQKFFIQATQDFYKTKGTLDSNTLQGLANLAGSFESALNTRGVSPEVKKVGDAAIKMIKEGTATLEQALASPSLTEEEKNYIKENYIKGGG